MTLDRLTPMLWTLDLPATIRFYQNILGFTIDEYNEEWGWCHLHKDSVALMFTLPVAGGDTRAELSFTGSLYFYTEQVDELFAQLRANPGVRISYSPANFAHGMREFGISDNNGYLLQFGRELREDEVVDDCD